MSNIVFIFPGCMGGVSSFYRNIINFTSLRAEVRIKVILLNWAEDDRPRFTDSISADEITEFKFSTLENQYYVAKRLAATIGEEDAWIVTDNMLPLNAAKFYRGSKALIFFVHDYFYTEWALQYRKLIDVAIAHSSFFRDILLSAAVKDYSGKAVYLPYGVEAPQSDWVKRPPSRPLKLVFLGRLIEDKGVLLLKEIDDLLQSAAVEVQWTIVGKGPLAAELRKQWEGSSYVSFEEARDTQHVFEILSGQDILIFPSRYEGTPVAIMEAMSRGVVPVVSDLPGGTRDIVTADAGFRCETMNAKAYADAVLHLYNNEARLKELQKHCIDKTREHFDIVKSSDAYIRQILSVKPSARKNGTLINISKLDRPFAPNSVVYTIRKFLKKLNE